jgi:predicted Zn-dependent peptidase
MKFNKVTLKNGLRVITVPMPDNPSVTVFVMVGTGSEYETKDTNGLSHFLEHMVFKGTTKRPKSIDISRELDSIGANYNAFTGQEYTGYYAKADARHFDKVLDVVSDMYMNPLFEQSEIDKEKGVIIEEIRMYNDLPQHQVQDVLSQLMFGDQPAGWTILGTEENLHSFTRKDFEQYRNDHYVSNTTTVIVSGNINEEEVIKKVQKAFSGVSDNKAKGKNSPTENQKEARIKTLFKDTDQTHLVIGVRTFPIKDARIPALSVLSTILGGGMSSRLFSKMRDELGICYYIRTSPNSFSDHGDLTISAGVDNSRVEEGIKGILEECIKLKNEIVSEEELKKAKDYISGTTLLELETSDARAEFAGFQEILKNEVESPEEIIAKINKVTALEVKELANEIFVNNKLNMAIVGKYKDHSVFKPYFWYTSP